MPTMHLVVTGKVQGVFYRAKTKDKADELGVSGWVQNREDGSVEIMATAAEPVLDEFINWCRKGPRLARVTGVQATPAADQDFTGFSVNR